MKLCVIGALAGVVIGFLFGGPFVAVGGALAGLGLALIADQLVLADDDKPVFTPGDDLIEAVASPEPLDLRAREGFLSHLVGLFTAVARCDGVIRREEIKAIRTFFEERFTLNDQDMELVSRLLRDALATPVDVDAALKGYEESSRPADRLLFLQALYEVALGDGEVVQEERQLINRICSELGISEQDHRTIRGLFFDEPSSEDDYALLGVEPGADDATLKKAFRNLAAKHHPDKVAHLGADASAMAGRRFAEIKLAYERIKETRAA